MARVVFGAATRVFRTPIELLPRTYRTVALGQFQQHSLSPAFGVQKSSFGPEKHLVQTELRDANKLLSYAFSTLPPHKIMGLPGLSEDCAGKVLKWYKDVGDAIGADEVLCDVELPSFGIIGVTPEDDGILAKRLLAADPAGAEVAHGTPLAVLVASPADLAAYLAADAAREAKEGETAGSTTATVEADTPTPAVAAAAAEGGGGRATQLIQTLRRLTKAGKLDEETCGVLLSLARKDEPENLIMNAFEGSFEEDGSLDEDFFLAQCTSIAKESSP
eukprot:CAMPEP_0194587996 /NCGR_PEP_ID=MMETSP0292-20121207/19497_1 /TAXON_ID=39354 /ORGANISM="Heterosigma akashiwo, Strain CCMP2393" /LENGTH=275 /DNA_ID=CAMNT_0039444375 /DNA_START=24 /DNA_END=851 /DNA_ORIENTATION=-